MYPHFVDFYEGGTVIYIYKNRILVLALTANNRRASEHIMGSISIIDILVELMIVLHCFSAGNQGYKEKHL